MRRLSSKAQELCAVFILGFACALCIICLGDLRKVTTKDRGRPKRKTCFATGDDDVKRASFWDCLSSNDRILFIILSIHNFIQSIPHHMWYILMRNALWRAYHIIYKNVYIYRINMCCVARRTDAECVIRRFLMWHWVIGTARPQFMSRPFIMNATTSSYTECICSFFGAQRKCSVWCDVCWKSEREKQNIANGNLYEIIANTIARFQFQKLIWSRGQLSWTCLDMWRSVDVALWKCVFLIDRRRLWYDCGWLQHCIQTRMKTYFVWLVRY